MGQTPLSDPPESEDEMDWFDEDTGVSLQRLDALCGPSAKGVVSEAVRAAEQAFDSYSEQLLAELDQED